MRAVAAVVLAAFSASMWSSNLLCAVPAALCSTFLAIGAITGWCPTQLLRGLPTRHRAEPHTLGVPEWHGDLVGATRHSTPSDRHVTGEEDGR